MPEKKPRPPNLIDTVKVTVRTNPFLESHLEELVRTGLYGKSKSEAAERLIADGVAHAIKDGLIDREPGGRRKE